MINAFLLILFACALYGFLPSFLAARWLKTWVHQQRGDGFYHWYLLASS